MTDLTKELPVEILEKIFQFLPLKDLCLALLVCRRWREVGETPALWSQFTVTVDKRNQLMVTDIMRSRRMKAVREMIIGEFVSLPEKGWMAVIGHTGLRELRVGCGSMLRTESGLVGRVVTSVETVSVCDAMLSTEQVTSIMTHICDSSTSTLKVLDISSNRWNFSVSRVDPVLLARAVTRLERVNMGETDLTEEQVTLLMTHICDSSTLTLKVLGLWFIPNVRRVKPELLAKAVTRLETLYIRLSILTEEQVTAIRKAAARSSCRVLYVQNVRESEERLNYWKFRI